MQTVLYTRSGSTQALAEQAGFHIDRVVPDGIDSLRAGDTLVVRWLDRLGRDDAAVCATLCQLLRRGVVVKTLACGFTFDAAATDPEQTVIRDALIGFLAASAEARA
jgi:putative DNA-invertase from lambdoid prophage Rac